MQNKGAIWAFTILLVIACLYQLSFSWITSGIEADANERAEVMADSVLMSQTAMDALEIDTNDKGGSYYHDSLKNAYEGEYLIEIGPKPVYPVTGMTYRDCKRNEINLGLDLQGGMSVTLEISTEKMIEAFADKSQNPNFLAAMKRARELKEVSEDDFAILFEQAWNEVAPEGERLAPIFNNRKHGDKFLRDDENSAIFEKIQEEAREAVIRTEQVLRKRIDNLGVIQPKVQRLTSSGRIIIELPGVKDNQRVAKILEGTARLEFWECVELNQELYQNLLKANKVLSDRIKAKRALEDTTSKVADVAPEAAAPEAQPEGEPAAAGIEPAQDAPAGIEPADANPDAAGAIAENDSTDSTTVDSGATAGSNATDITALQGDDQVDSLADAAQANAQNAEINAIENPLFSIFRLSTYTQEGQEGQFLGTGAVIGTALAKDRKKISEFLNRQEIQNIFGRRIRWAWGAKPQRAVGSNIEVYELFCLDVKKDDGEPSLAGDVITNAYVDAGQDGAPEVVLIMNGEGAAAWQTITGNNVGQHVAIVLDSLVYSAPTVTSQISGGRSNISGGFDQQEASDLANVLKAGELEVPSTIIESQVVGPSLGDESVSKGLNSFLVALGLVLIYMIFYYARAGVVADVALFANMFFIIGVLASLNATLTLPGIAGIVLTIGMSVDANVLIYERIREELAAGKGMRLALVDGYNNAYSAIIDANITTLLTGVVLNVFGTGPIKGFATTLIIGILTSLFSAIFITRLIFEWRMDRNKKINFATKMTEGAFKNLSIPFVNRRKLFYGISGTIVVLGVVSLATKGLHYGVDFEGGRNFTVTFESPADIDKIGDELAVSFADANGTESRPEVKEYGNAQRVSITTKYGMDIDSAGSVVDSIVYSKLTEGLTNIGDGFTVDKQVKVESTIADDIRSASIWAVSFSLLIIFLYIVFRFKRWQFGLGALVAMFHDVVVVLAIFSIFYGILPFSLEVDQAFIAAILTVVGYSINDTVVVFDRIREYLGLYKRKAYNDVVNSALNSTLSRTINTSVSTFVVLLMIFIFGGEVIRGFVFALMVGVVVGTYSSLCVATPIVLDFNNRKQQASGKK